MNWEPRHQAPRARATQPTRGAILIAVIACLAVASMMLSSMAHKMLLARRQIHTQTAYHQARWLCKAGLQQATFKLTRDPDYTGETWRVDPAHLNGRDAGEVEITVESHDDSIRQIQVVARFPAGQITAVQYSQTVRLPARQVAADTPVITNVPSQDKEP